MIKVQLVYDTTSGATFEIAGILRNEFSTRRLHAEVRHVDEVADLSYYDAVVVGSPIRLAESTSKTKRFLKKHVEALASLPTAFYFSCLSVITLADKGLPKIPIYFDPSFDIQPRQRREMNVFEYLHTSHYYLKQFLKLIPTVDPVSIAFFKGRLDFSRISFMQRMIMTVALRLSDEIQKGEFLSPRAARGWAEELHARFTA